MGLVYNHVNNYKLIKAVCINSEFLDVPGITNRLTAAITSHVSHQIHRCS